MNKEQINELLDVLILEKLSLIEELIQCKVKIEKHTNEGRLLLAKTRYTQGTQTVSTAQLPTENSAEFNALTKVVTDDNKNQISGKEFTIQKCNVDKNAGYVDPIQWFGVLSPRSMQMAKEKFQKSIDLVVECVNIQNELIAVVTNIRKLKQILPKKN